MAANPQRPAVALIIPAKDEEERIQNVLRAACGSRLASEIIVVDDGSDDDTAAVARRMPSVKVLELPQNRGKGGAMAAGVASTKAPIVAFIDADLSGLTGEHIDRIILPVMAGECDMCIGVFTKGKALSTGAQKIAPNLSGQRAMRRELFESVTNIGNTRMGVEVALNEAARRRRARLLYVKLLDVANCIKEQKLGLRRGGKERTKMYIEIAKTYVTSKRQAKAKRFRPLRRPWV